MTLCSSISPVAEDAIGPVGLLFCLCCQGHSHCGADPLAERAGGHIDAGNMHHVRVAGNMPAYTAQEFQIGLREVTAQSKDRVERRRTVAFAQHKTITVWFAGAFGSIFISLK